jgi:DNA polymerase III subunit delta
VAKKPSSSPAALSADHLIVALIGKEPFLQSEYTSQLKDLLTAKHGEVEPFRFDGAQTTLAAVLDECRTFGLMVQHKVVIVDQADEIIKEENRPLMERYAAAPCESATLVLRCDKWYKGKLDALIEAVGIIKKCEPPSPADAITWSIKRCAKRHHATLERDAAELLVERLGADLGRLDMELAKLASNAGSADGKPGTINIKTVRDLVGMTREEEVWTVQTALLNPNPAAALQSLHEAIEISGHHPTLVTYACLDLARKLHGASRGLRGGENPWQLAGKLKLWPESKKEAILAVAKRGDPSRLAGLLKAAVDADRRQKTGQTNGPRALEVLALKFAEALAG